MSAESFHLTFFFPNVIVKFVKLLKYRTLLKCHTDFNISFTNDKNDLVDDIIENEV